nr:hypothetical protein [Deinococcus taeanensis]
MTVVGHDDTVETALLPPPLTTVRHDFPARGRRAFAYFPVKPRGSAHAYAV